MNYLQSAGRWVEIELVGAPPFATATLSSSLVAPGGAADLVVAIDTRLSAVEGPQHVALPLWIL